MNLYLECIVKSKKKYNAAKIIQIKLISMFLVSKTDVRSQSPKVNISYDKIDPDK